jgi:hypothetical protein
MTAVVYALVAFAFIIGVSVGIGLAAEDQAHKSRVAETSDNDPRGGA